MGGTEDEQGQWNSLSQGGAPETPAPQSSSSAIPSSAVTPVSPSQGAPVALQALVEPQAPASVPTYAAQPAPAQVPTAPWATQGPAEKRHAPNRRLVIILSAVAAVVVIAVVGFFAYRSSLAENASKEVHSAFEAVVATNDSLDTVVNGAGIYTIGLCTNDELSDAEDALDSINQNLDEAEAHLNNASPNKDLMTPEDQAAYDNLVQTISSRRAMADAADTIIGGSKGIPDARDSLGDAEEQLNNGVSDVASAVSKTNSLDMDGARTDANNALTAAAAAASCLETAKADYPDADYSALETHAATITTCANALVSVCDAFDARDEATFDSAVSEYNDNRSSLNISYDTATGPSLFYETNALLNLSDAMGSFKGAALGTVDADASLSTYYGQDMGLDTFMTVYE
jgi:hypothetical protein